MTEGQRAADFAREFYPFLYPEDITRSEAVLEEVRCSTLQKCQDVVALRQQVLERHADDLVRAAEAMAGAFRLGATLLAFGNGGSATDAQDIAGDFLSPPIPGRPSLPALSLTNDNAVVTALGNDVGFPTVFARQVRALGRRGDIALAVSTSGNSPNVLEGLEAARRVGMLTVAILGYDGGRVAGSGLADYLFVVPSTYIPRIQEVQATIYHTLWDLVHRVLALGGDGQEAQA